MCSEEDTSVDIVHSPQPLPKETVSAIQIAFLFCQDTKIN